MFAAMLRALPAGFIAPCLPTKGDTLPSGEVWLREIKHDGFRIIARKDGDRVTSVMITSPDCHRAIHMGTTR
jgi:ATP-dependent DNA ligase